MAYARDARQARRDGRRAGEWRRTLMLVALCAAGGAYGCADPTGPVTGDGTYALESIAGVKIPATFTDGTCRAVNCPQYPCAYYPDQKYVVSGKLVLRGTHFDMEYGWVGATPECCFWGARKGPTWHLVVSGEYATSGSSLFLRDPNVGFAATRAGNAIVVAGWGELRDLRFVR